MEFLVKGIRDTNVRAYYDFMADAAIMFGADKGAAERELLDSLNFEIELAKVLLRNETSPFRISAITK